MPSRLLVPLDGSALAESAVPWAACLAGTAGYAIVLAQAVPWPLIATEVLISAYALPEMYDDILNAECEGATNHLNRVRAGLVDQGLQVELVVRAGAPTTAVLDIADETGADMIVMATHGRGGLPRLVLGGFASYVVQHATIPVMLVGPGPTSTAGAPALDHLLIPLVGSMLAERALDYAAGFAQTGVTLALLRVEAPELAFHTDKPSTDAARAGRSETFGEAARYLQPIQVRLVGRTAFR
jgi:nucleotide-binding universal stress UspA family protein